MMESGKLRVGLAGLGAWGRNLLRCLAAAPEVELAAVCDVSAAARQAAMRNHAGVVGFESFDAMVDEIADLDAVVIATPPRLHYGQALRALEAGLHVLVEKPMCMSTPECRTVTGVAGAAQRVLMAGHTFLYSNLVREVKRRIASGVLGEVLCIHGQRLNLGRVRHDVDALWNFAPHDISITSYLLDQWPEAVTARGSCFLQRDRGIVDSAVFQMDFCDGQVMCGHVSWLDPLKVRRMVVVGTEGMLVYDDIDARQPIQIYDKSVQTEFQSSPRDYCEFKMNVRAGNMIVPTIGQQEPLRVEIDHFVACVRSGGNPMSNGESGLRVVGVLEAMSQSMNHDGALTRVDYGVREATVDRSAVDPSRQAPKALPSRTDPAGVMP